MICLFSRRQQEKNKLSKDQKVSLNGAPQNKANTLPHRHVFSVPVKQTGPLQNGHVPRPQQIGQAHRPLQNGHVPRPQQNGHSVLIPKNSQQIRYQHPGKQLVLQHSGSHKPVFTVPNLGHAVPVRHQTRQYHYSTLPRHFVVHGQPPPPPRPQHHVQLQATRTAPRQEPKRVIGPSRTRPEYHSTPPGGPSRTRPEYHSMPPGAHRPAVLVPKQHVTIQESPPHGRYIKHTNAQAKPRPLSHHGHQDKSRVHVSTTAHPVEKRHQQSHHENLPRERFSLYRPKSIEGNVTPDKITGMGPNDVSIYETCKYMH